MSPGIIDAAEHLLQARALVHGEWAYGAVGNAGAGNGSVSLAGEDRLVPGEEPERLQCVARFAEPPGCCRSVDR